MYCTVVRDVIAVRANGENLAVTVAKSVGPVTNGRTVASRLLRCFGDEALEVRQSTGPQPQFGLGLFVRTKAIHRADIFTEYGGIIYDRMYAQKLRKQGLGRYCRSAGNNLVIDGWRHSQLRIGDGLASLVNDPKGTTFQANAKFLMMSEGIDKKLPTPLCRRLGISTPERVFLKATMDIEPGSEVWVSYCHRYHSPLHAVESL